jgi:hypothetical protein
MDKVSKNLFESATRQLMSAVWRHNPATADYTRICARGVHPRNGRACSGFAAVCIERRSYAHIQSQIIYFDLLTWDYLSLHKLAGG